ncbi:MAG: peroxiredoxin family protein [Granulosicoccus sp.]
MPSNINQPSTLTRRRFLRHSVAGSTLLATSGLTTQAIAQDNSAPEPGIEGQAAPELEVDYWIDAEGKPANFSMAESRGQWVFLKCFQNWCPGCHKSGFPTLKAFSDRFHDHPDVAIAGIQTVFEGYSSNTRDAVRELQLSYELPITMGHDPGNQEKDEYSSTMVNYRTGGTPWLILVNPEGVVVFNRFYVNTEALIDYVAEQVA